MDVAPSILSADFANLGACVHEIENAGAEYLHIDVMDGIFVPNISIGLPVVRSMRKISKLTFDVHLMILRPMKYIESFAAAGADIITVHLESEGNTAEQIETIKRFGCKACVAVKPSTPTEAVFEFLDSLDMVLIMTVEPGFGGQKLLEPTLKKIPHLKNEITKRGLACKIEVDGGVNLENAELLHNMGADIAVAGSAVFESKNISETIRQFLRC